MTAVRALPAAHKRISDAWGRAPVAARQEWLLGLLGPICAPLPGVSAVVGRGRLEDLREAWSAADKAERREWLDGLLRSIPGVADRPRGGAQNFPNGQLPIVDLIPTFLRHRTRPKFGGRIRSTEFYEAYLSWAKANGQHHLTHKMFARELIRFGLSKVKGSSTYWISVELSLDSGPADAVLLADECAQ